MEQREHSENENDLRAEAGGEGEEKKPYSPPQLADYGPLQNLTLGFSGTGNTDEI